MHRSFTVITLITGVVASSPRLATAGPGGEARGHEAERATRNTTPSDLITRAGAAAIAGDCAAVNALGLTVRELERGPYDLALVAAIHTCLERGGAPVPPPASWTGRRTAMLGVGTAASLATSDGHGRGIPFAELRLGWMIRPQLAVFANLTGGIAPESATFRIVRGGARASHGRLFAEAQLGVLRASPECDFEDDPCAPHRTVVGAAGLGFELIHLRHFGFELRADALIARDARLYLAGIGMAVYL